MPEGRVDDDTIEVIEHYPHKKAPRSGLLDGKCLKKGKRRTILRPNGSGCPDTAEIIKNFELNRIFYWTKCCVTHEWQQHGKPSCSICAMK